MFKKLLLLLCISAPALADFVVINPQAIRNKTGDEVYLCLENRMFYVVNVTQQTLVEVNLAFSDKLVRQLRTQEAVESFFRADGNITLKQCSNGDYVLTASIPLRGGGLATAALFWLGYQTACFTAIFTGTLVVNAALPGVGGVAAGFAIGGSYASALAAIQAGGVKAFAIGLALPTP